MRPPNHSSSAGFALAMIAAVWLFCPAALAKPIVQDDAVTAVHGWLHQPGRGLKTPLGNEVKDTEVYTDAAGDPLYFVVNLQPSGFVIVPADDLVEPILFFCPAGQYVASEKNPLGALVMQDVPGRLALARAKAAAANLQPHQKNAQRKWGQLRAATADAALPGLSSVSDLRVAAIMQSLWDQSSTAGGLCYNYYTPGNVYDGCVATAMAQLMRFYQYPTAGVGTASFEIEANGTWESANLRGGNGSGGPYDWADMPLVPANGLTTTQRQAIGALCYDAGVSVNMEYSGSGSGADPTEIAPALKSVFFYSNAICGGNGNNFGSGLIGMLNPNLDAGFPCLLSIYATNGDGHEIVADGYGYESSTLYYHLNLGWSGYDNGWYNLPDFDAGGYDWVTVAFCLYNVYPAGNGEIISGRVTDSAGAAISGVTVTGTRAGGGVYTATTNAHGIYALAQVPSASSYTLTAVLTGYAFSPQNVSTGTSSNYSTTSADVWGANFTPTSVVSTWTLAVNSSPVQGVEIAGTYSGTTNYSATGVTDGTAVSLTAPAGDPAGYTFSQWTVNGAAQPSGQKTITFTMFAAATAVAVYTSGGLTVTLSPAAAVTAGAQWQVDGGAWQNSAATVTGLSAGNHTVTYQTVPGWTAPVSEQVSVANGATKSITRTYVQQTGGICVVLGPAAAVVAGAQWNVDGGAWQSSGATVSDLAVGNHTVKYLAIAGWNAPPNALVPVTSNTTTSITGTYVQQTGSVQVTLAPVGAITAGAQWNVDGGAWQISGATVSGLAVAVSHTVNYNTITGWNSPSSTPATITCNNTTAATGTYVQQTGSLTVTLAPAAAVTAGAQWSVDGGAPQNSGASVSGLTLGSHTVNFSTLTGWTPPSSAPVTITSNNMTTAMGTYVQQTGSVQVTLTPVGAITAGAQWSVDGGAWQISGATVSGLAVGLSHAINYNTIANWNSPATASPTITYNTTTNVTGLYAQQTGSLTVILEPAAAISAGAMWNVDGGGWLDSGATVTGLSVGAHTVVALPLTAWSAPPAKSVVIGNNEITTLTGMYGQDPNSPAVTGMLPASGAWNAPTGTLIELHITDAGPGVDASTVTIQASLDGVTWEPISDGSASYVASNNKVFNGVANRAGTPADYVYVFQPAAPFNFEDQVYIQVNASDLDREVMPPFIYNFTIEARSFGCNVRADGGTAGDDFPATATDAGGNVWVAWERTDAVTQMGTLWLAERLKDAWNFGSEIPVTTASQNGDCHKPAIAITANGTICMAYEAHGATPAVGVVTATTAAPTTWTSLGAVAGAGNALMTSPAITVDSTGDLSVVGVSLVKGVKQVVAGTLASGATVWTVTQVTSNSGDQISPAITQDAAGIVYVVWTNTQDNNLYGADSGAGWATIHPVTSSGNAGSPVIAAEQSGPTPVLHFAWTATGGTPNPAIEYAETTGGWAGAPLTGTNVMDEVTASNAANPRIAVTGTTSSSVCAGVFIVWQDQRSGVPGDTDIMFVERKRNGQFGTNILVSVVPPGAGLVTDSAQYNPAFGVTTDGTPYSAWTDLREAGARHIYFAAAMDACLCGSQPSSVLIPVAGGAANFTDPTNLHFTDLGITVPANAFTTPRNIVANELRNPVAECSGGSGIFTDGSGLYLDITGGVDEALGGWVTISTQLTPGAALPSPLTVYRLVPPATPLDSWTWTTDLIQNVSYNPTTCVLTFETRHLSSFGVGATAPAAASSSGSGGGGGGGGGGCAMSSVSGGEPDVFVLVLPLAAMGFWTAIRLIRRGRSAKARRSAA